MSIPPIDAQSSKPSAPLDPLQNPTSDDGIADRSPRRGLDPRRIAGASVRGGGGSAEEAAAESGGDVEGEDPGSAVGIGGSCDLPKNGVEHKSPNARKESCGQSEVTFSEGRSAMQGGISSQFGPGQLGSQTSRRSPGTGKFIQSDHSASGSSVYQGNTAYKRNQVGNANYLLNFHYNPIPRPTPRAPPPRRQRKIKPYNKDLFLQANYKFVVLDTGSYQVELMDPDKMLQWEDIISVRYSTPFTVKCPICLDTPLCPQITSCGHIYCFPCILRYLLMGKGDHKGDSWKKCPLCFMMISSRDLCTIQIENVKQFHVGDNVHFTLLTRLKDSLVPSLKNNQEEGSLQYSSDGINDLFSKFTLTSDVEFSAREAKLDLNNWLSKAESGFIDDLERLPYVCAALEQLEERIKSWLEQLTISPPLKNSAIISSRSKVTKNSNKAGSNVLASTSASNHASTTALESGGRTSYSDLRHVKLDESSHTSFTHVPELSSSSEKGLLFDEDRTSQDTTERDSYTFYQAIDGQHLILHPLNMKCLLHHYGSYDMLPPRISGEILEMETLTQSEAIRKRYRYLSHFSLTTSIQLCEIDLREILPTSSFTLFKEEIKKREKKRKQLARKEQNEKVRAEAVALSASPIFYDQNYSPPKEANFSSDDFEALGNSVVPSTSPPINGERKKFSDVTRLGFAAAHDSPTLRAEGSSDLLRNTEKIDEASNSQGLGQRSMSTALSFANIMSSAKATGNPAAQNTNNELGKKGKKQTKVLLSTAGGRRY